MTTATLPTITTEAALQALVDGHADAIEAGELFLRWSHGPERDEANGWVSRNWAHDGDEEDDGNSELDGLCACKIWSATVDDVRIVARAYMGQVHGSVCYLLTGTERGECPDGEPVVQWVEPVAIIDTAVVRG